MRFTAFLLILGVSLTLAEGFKMLLVNPKFGGSHTLFMGKLADVLAAGGHELVVLQMDSAPEFRNPGHRNKSIRLITRKAAVMFDPPDSYTKVWTHDWNSDVSCC